MTVSRRDMLVATAGSLSAIAGCSGLRDSDEDPAPINHLQVENRTQKAHTVHLQLRDAGEVTYWRSVDVPVTTPDAEVTTGVTQAPDFPQPPGEYTLLARLDNRADWRQTDFTEISVSEETCFGIYVTVEENDILSVMWSVDEAMCSMTTSEPADG